MSDEDFTAIYSEFLIFYNNNVPDMEHEPIRFHYYVKLFLTAGENKMDEQDVT